MSKYNFTKLLFAIHIQINIHFTQSNNLSKSSNKNVIQKLSKKNVKQLFNNAQQILIFSLSLYNIIDILFIWQ